MKTKIILIICIISICCHLHVMAGEKQEAHIAYVLKNAKLSKEANAKLKPVLAEYYKDRSAIKAAHKQLKDKLESKEDAGKLTATECDQLFESKHKQETAELELKKKLYSRLKTMLSAPQAYKVVKLADDKVK